MNEFTWKFNIAKITTLLILHTAPCIKSQLAMQQSRETVIEKESIFKNILSVSINIDNGCLLAVVGSDSCPYQGGI